MMVRYGVQVLEDREVPTGRLVHRDPTDAVSARRLDIRGRDRSSYSSHFNTSHYQFRLARNVFRHQ